MKISIKSIDTNELYTSDPKFITVSVIFQDLENEPCKSATVTVFIDKLITDINEIKAAAIQEAKKFILSLK